MFINPTPMTLELERYDETGRLTTVLLKNRAAELIQNLSGYGNPNGVVEARPGVLYTDLVNNVLYYKTQDDSDQGWVGIYSEENEGSFLKINGSAANLTNLNVDHVTDGVLSVEHGGTGNSGTFSGMLKANGTGAYTRATEGEDYIDPNGLVGMISYFPKNEVRSNWFLCDGGTFTASEYPKLNE